MVALWSKTQNYLLQIAPIAGGHPFPYTVPITVVPDQYSPGEVWRLEHFGTTEDSEATSDAGDFDDDGISNLLERALGGDPSQMDHANETTLLLAGDRSKDGTKSGFPSVKFSQLFPPPGDVTYAVQASSDLIQWEIIASQAPGESWSAIGAETIVNEGVVVDEVREIEVIDGIDSDVARYLRLKVSASP